MAKTPESKFRAEICKQLVKCNARIINNPQYVGETQSGAKIFPEPGISDVIMVHRYTGIVFLEFKAARGKLSPVQKNFLIGLNDRVPYSGFMAQEPGLLYYITQNEVDDLSFWPFETGKDLIQVISEIKKIKENQ